MHHLCRASRLLCGSLAGPSAADEQPKRAAASGPGWTEVFISPMLACGTQSAADAVAAGFSLLLLLELADHSECEGLRKEASAVARASRRRSTMLRGALLEDVPDEAVTPGQVRMPIAEMLCEESQALCDRLLLRGVRRLHGSFPTLLPRLFGDGGIGGLRWADMPLQGPTSICRNPGLAFTPGEPACNVYTSGGQFTPHEDGQALTVILVLTGGERGGLS